MLYLYQVRNRNINRRNSLFVKRKNKVNLQQWVSCNFREPAQRVVKPIVEIKNAIVWC